MTSNASYPDPDAPMGSSVPLYGTQNGGTPPAQQQQHLPSDADLQMHENLAQLQRSNDMMQAGPGQGQQMNPLTHHFQSPPRPTHSPQQMAQTIMSMEDTSMYSDHDSASRKRSKVSRACDECRRKKIRCDATNENGPEACSSCKRTGARCQFSRQPMKRGPSKGYIKELADRLVSLENQIQHAPTPAYDYPSVSDHGVPDPHMVSQLARKRTHSMSEGLQDPYNRPSWSGQDRDFPTSGQNIRRPSFNDMTLAGNLITGSNEGAIKAYYHSIHPVLPILSHESSSLNRLTNCPAKLREGFLLALECSVRAHSPAALPPVDFGLSQLVQQCLETLVVAEQTLDDAEHSRQFYNNLVYSQSLIFLVIASDRPGPSESGRTADLLGRLSGRISHLGLNDAKVVETLREQDRETFDETRRLFWVGFILDRFHASGRDKDTVLPTRCGIVSRDDFHALGEIGYHLARAADIVGQITQISKAANVPNIDSASPFAFAALTSSTAAPTYLNGQLSRFRESLDITDLLHNSPPYLAYQYLRILEARFSAHTASKVVLSLAKELLHNLTITPISPLHHVFAHLVAVSLCELSDRIETQVEAHAAIKELDDAIANGQVTHRVLNGTGWDTAIRNMLHQKKALTPPTTAVERTSPVAQPNMAGLQHLAAAAVGEREGGDGRPASSGGNGTLSQPTQESMKHDVSAAMAAASEAAAAQATAAAAQEQMQNATGNNNGGNTFDPSALV